MIAVELSDVELRAKDWMAVAQCRTERVALDVFFPEVGGNAMSTVRYAKEICGRCPVTVECLDYATVFNIRWGVWGGTTEDDRRGGKRRRNR